MKHCISFCLLLLPMYLLAQGKIRATPDKLYGQLFVDVQEQQVFADGKMFVDAVPRRKVADIMYDYGMMKGPGLDLAKFVNDNFILPHTPQFNYIQAEPNPISHVTNLWGYLQRQPDTLQVAGSSLIPLPHPYIVPGGRFREVYYWDSYFTMLGLKESKQGELIANMVANFSYLIDEYGHVPNGNRTYYLSRSQPPFFCMMVALLAEVKGRQVYKKYLPQMQREYAYWMEGSNAVAAGGSFKRVVKLADGTIMNRYWDDEATPRQESYREDVATAEEAAQQLAMLIRVSTPEKLKEILDNRKATAYRDLRAGACSGWDFSSRWLKDEAHLYSIQTTQLVPVDLNCLLYFMEQSIANAAGIKGDTRLKKTFTLAAAKRKKAILKHCWSQSLQYFVDYDLAANEQSTSIHAAGMFPLFVKIATPLQAAGAAKTLSEKLVKPGGVVTTTINSGQQWDAPNGWAPLQWTAVIGLRNYNNVSLANNIASRWVALNEKVYSQTGKMMEKYNVEDLSKEAGGGEYATQDGFGWTNGVYLAMKRLLRVVR